VKYLIIPLFFLALLFPHIDKPFDLDNTVSRENRELKSFPDLKNTKLNDLPSQLTEYINDNFGFRKWLIQQNAKIKYYIFKSAPNKNVIVGKDNYLFLNHSAGEGDLIFQDYTHRNLLEQKELNLIGAKYQLRNRKLSQLGIGYYRGFYPNKHSIYSDKLPQRASSCILDSVSKTDQIIEHLTENKILSVIDFRPNLIAKKSEFNLYVKGDTHWNEMGSFIAHQKLLKYIQKDYPEIQLASINDYDILWVDDSNIKAWKTAKKSICNNKCYEDYLVGKDNTLYSPKGLLNLIGFNLTETQDSFPVFIPKSTTKIVKTSEDLRGRDRKEESYENLSVTNNLKVLVFRDSYSLNLIKFFNQHFKEVTYLRSKFDIDKVKKHKPDLIIDCTVERHFS